MFQNIGTSGAKGMDGSGLMQGLGSASPYIGIASSFINPLLVDQSDPTHENFTPILGSIDYAKQDVNVIDNEFDPSSCLLYTSPSPRDRQKSRMPSSA